MGKRASTLRLLLAVLLGTGLSLTVTVTIHAAILVVDLAARPPLARLNGVEEGGHAGWALAVGDLNDDGQADLIVGAPDESPGAVLTQAGRIYVFFNPPSLIGVLPLSQANLTMSGDRAWGRAGSALAVGDLNDDGIADLVIGAPAEVAPGEYGRAYVVYGRSSFPTSLSLSQANVVVSGTQAGAWAGYALATGDLDGDGKHDLAVGAPAFSTGPAVTRTGQVYVFLSSQGTLTGGVSAADADLTVSGQEAYAAVGTSVAIADVSGDGTYEDLIIGAPFDDPFASPHKGEVAVFFGSGSLTGSRTVAQADLRITGMWVKDWLGRMVAAGDVNGNGVADLVIGATGDGQAGEGFSTVYLFYGRSGLSGSLPASAADVVLASGAPGEQSGYSLGTGNLDGDGRADLVVGARMSTLGARLHNGRAYILYGSRITTTGNLYADAGVVLEGPAERGRMGMALALGDFLDLPYDGLALGAPFTGEERGAVYLLKMPPRGVRLQPDYNRHIEEAGGSTVYTHTLTNLCILTDTFDLTYTVVEGSGWKHWLHPVQVTVPGLATATVYFSVTAPVGSGRVVDVSVVTATSRADLSAVARVTDRSEAGWGVYLPVVLRR